MEQVDYKEKYEDLIKRITKMANCQPTITKLAIESLFPELKESEDERIRKEILDYIIKGSESFYDIQQYGKEKFGKWIAWLEKQGEQKSTNNQFTPEQASVLDKHIDKFLEQKPAWSENDEEITETLNSYVKNIDCLFTSIKIGDKDVVAVKFREKVQAWLKSLKDRVFPRPEWSEEEKARIDRIIDVLDWAEEKGRISYSDWEDYVCYVKCLRPQSNTKWYKVDDRIQKEIINFFECQKKDEPTRKDTINKWIDWLKDRVQPQPKQEWSEEDENILSDIIKDLVHPWNEYIPDRIEDEIKWLKNRLKSLKDRYTWKPSKEQMLALNIAIEMEDGDILKSLYQDLLKLKEE